MSWVEEVEARRRRKKMNENLNFRVEKWLLVIIYFSRKLKGR